MSYYQNKTMGRNNRSYSAVRNRSTSRKPKKAYINPSRYIQGAKPTVEVSYEPTNKFTDFKINPIIQQNLVSMGYTKPSPIQDQTIANSLTGRDIVGIADTGTGKTAAFAIPLLNRLMENRQSRALILAPTRELAQQIEEQCRQIAKGSGLDGALLIGGLSMRQQLNELRFNPRIIIGTPGRIKDHLNQRTLDLRDCDIVVIDEVDRMLDMGFITDISYIIEQTNKDKQSFYFSATIDNKVKAIIEGFTNNPLQVSVKSGETSDNVEQNIVSFNSADDKINKLHDLLLQESTVKTLVFDDTQRSVEKLAKELQARGFSSDSIHGGKSQPQRQQVLRKFKDNHINVLVATDVAARGLDVSDISHVINYAQPQSFEDYVHRIGRTGRAGKTGHALTFIEQ